MLVEGMGGIMTPILKNYFVTNLIREMNLDVILITRSRIGTINHTLMTCKMCVDNGIRIKGIIINNFDIDGYPPTELKRDMEKLTTFPVLGIIPRLDNFEIDLLRNTIEKEIDIESLLN